MAYCSTANHCLTQIISNYSATLDCGAVINIPGFIEQGTKIRVDTEKGEYLDRVNN